MTTFLETERLLLRKFSFDDFDELYLMACDPEVMRYFPSGPRTREDVKERLGKMISYYNEHPGFGFFAVILKKENSFIGAAGIKRLDNTDEIEFGYRFKEEYWGKGYASEVSRALVRYGFIEKNLQRIVAVASPENFPSRHVIEKCGLEFEKNSFYYNSPVAYYSLTKEKFLSE